MNFMDAMTPPTKVAKKSGKKGHKSASELFLDVVDIAANFGGETVRQVVDELLDHFNQTTDMLYGLTQAETRESINFLYSNALASLSEASRKVASGNDMSDTMQASDFGEFVESFKTILLKKCRSQANFSPYILPHLDAALPMLLQPLTEIYANIISTGFGLSFAMLNQGTSMVSLLDRPELVSEDTFKGFAEFPNEFKNQLETTVNMVLTQYVDPAQLEMMLGMAKMYASNFASSRAPDHDEL